MQGFTVVVPAEGSREQLEELLGAPLARGAAIVTSGRRLGSDVEIVVATPHFSQETFADVAKRAVQQGRRARVPAELLTEVGYLDTYEGEIRLLRASGRQLDRYLGRPVYRNDLEASDSRSKQRDEARHAARRAHLSGNIAKAMEIRSRHNVWYW